jgi:hypothetical protein
MGQVDYNYVQTPTLLDYDVLPFIQKEVQPLRV